MNKLAAVDAQSDARAAADAVAGSMVARVRLMMIVSGLTTLIAIAAVVGVVGYRVYHAGASAAAAPVQGIVTLPKGAHVIASTIAGDRLVVTLEVGGASEIRTYDLKTLKETGRIRFATEP